MKAIDYYREYEHYFFGVAAVKPLDEIQERIEELEKDFLDEANEIFAKRNGQTREAYEKVCQEQTDKWNALVRIFEKKRGVSPIKPRNVPFKKGVYEKEKPIDEGEMAKRRLVGLMMLGQMCKELSNGGYNG